MATFQKIVRLYRYFFVFITNDCSCYTYGQAKKNTKYPPQVGACPDYWQKDASTGNVLMFKI